MAIIARKHQQPDAKTAELFIYIAERLKDHAAYGAIYLNKVFYLADCISFLHYGAQISGFQYIKQELGPTPKPSQLLPLKEYLVSSGDIEEVRSEYFGRVQIRCIAKRSPDLSLFTSEEIASVEKAIVQLSIYNGKGASDFTHSLIAYTVPKMKEEIPLNAFLLTSRVPDHNDMAWAQGVIAKYERDV